MATPDRRLTYGRFRMTRGRHPTIEDVEDGYVRCECGQTLTPDEFTYYTFQCEACEKRRPDVPRVLGTSEDPERPVLVDHPGFDTANTKHKAEQRRAPLDNVTELPAGKYDATRTLRYLLAMAEKGKIESVVVIVTEPEDGPKDDGVYMWATWSDQTRNDVWWAAGWLRAFLNRRYFHGRGPEEIEE